MTISKMDRRRSKVTYLGEILPVDGFIVTLNVNLPQGYEGSLYHLYQPLIGIEAVHLYEFFVYEARLTKQLSVDKQTHHTLMNHLNLPLQTIYEARLKLEAIGLLKTYKIEDRQGKLYTYDLVAPFTPQQFFNDLMLVELLERQIGSRRFEQLQAYYVSIEEKSPEREEITASFHDVFQTYEPSSTTIPQQNLPEAKPEIQLEQVDFTLIEAALEQRNIPLARVLTKTNKRIITQLTNLYGLESYELEKALLWALTEEHHLDIEQFKAACHDFSATKEHAGKVKLALKSNRGATEGRVVETNQSKPASKIDELVARLESISPKQLLEDLSGGNHADEQDLKMISEIMIKQGLSAPVMNVLIHFTMLKTNMMLSRPYMERVASHWSRAQLKTAKEAMDFALQQTKPKGEPRRRQTYRKQQATTKEVIPDWFKNRNEKGKQEQPASASKDNQAVEKEMAAILKKYSH